MSGAPVSSANQLPMEIEWSTGLYDCFSDCGSCCFVFWCPYVAFGRMSEIIDEGSTTCCVNALIVWALSSCAWLYTYRYRSRLRGKYGLPESTCADCCVHFWCWGCALCQEYRELQNRGFNMHISWQGNVERQNREVTMAPVFEGGMNR